MNKKIILFIGLIICFLGVFAYVGILEKQKINKETSLSFSAGSVNRLPTEKEINWDTITPEYFLEEDIFHTDLETKIRDIKKEGDNKIKIKAMFMRNWYDEENNSIIRVVISEHKDKFSEPILRNENEIGIPKQVSENTTMTYLGSFVFQDEIVENDKFETKLEQGIETAFYLRWNENRFSFSIKAISAEYQDEIKKIAENIINKYPK